jgi:hypothetical protein
VSVLAVVESGVQAGLTPHTSDLVIVRDPSTTTLFFLERRVCRTPGIELWPTLETRFAAGDRQARQNQAWLGPTEPCTERSRFLLSSGREWGEYS